MSYLEIAIALRNAGLSCFWLGGPQPCMPCQVLGQPVAANS